MAKRSVRIRLEDIIEAIEGAEEILNDRDFDGYRQSFGTRKGIERCVEIISEASRHIPDEICRTYPHIQWHSIRAIGNILRHEYGRVDDFVIWQIATQSFPELKLVVKQILASFIDPTA
jgi:uncharacterized protein with HEPN domain